jgi:hypothetical protein
MSKHVLLGLLVLLAGAAAIVVGSLLISSKEGAGLALIFGGVVVDFVGLFIATTSARRNGAQGNGGNVPSGLSDFLS